MNDKLKIDEHESQDQKWNRGLDIFIESVHQPDPKLRSCVNFSDPKCVKALMLPLGLEELRAVVQYEVMNL